jgi:hypothetical protein
MKALRFWGRKPPPLTIQEILRGCTPGRMQSVGVMQVIPLASDLEDARILPPDEAVVSTCAYGTLLFENPTARLMLVPSHAGYMTKRAAQDHATPGAAFVRPREKLHYRRAMCIQESQAGLMGAKRREMIILPLSLRRPALVMGDQGDYSRLWDDIRRFNAEGGLAARGNLVQFLNHYRRELEQFVAEFEIVPRQVGAIVLVAGEVVGVERAPSHAFWAAVWEPLIRTCYGAYAIHVARRDGLVPSARAPLPRADSLDALAMSLRAAEIAEHAEARAKVRSLLDRPFRVSRVETQHGYDLDTVSNDQFIGQVVRAGEQVVYASLVAGRPATNGNGRRAAAAFEI